MLLDCGNQLQQHLSKVVDENGAQAIAMYETAECFAANVAASIAFGVDVDCFANPNHPFQENLRHMCETNMKNGLRFVGWLFQPTLLKWSRLRFMDRAVEEYFLRGESLQQLVFFTSAITF